MKRFVYFLLIAASCMPSPPPPEPGEPMLSIGTDWIVREGVKGSLSWPSAKPCTNNGTPAGCADGTMTVRSMTCHGCVSLLDWTGVTMPTSTVLEIGVAATGDGPASLDVTMSFDATDDVRTVSVSASADHEVALDAQCRLLSASMLAQLTPFATVADAGLRPCGSPRQAGDRVVILPTITTQHSGPRFPFCLTSYPCDGPMGEQFRALSSLMMAPSPALWAVSEADTPGAFAVLPPLTTATPISLLTTLVTGETVTATITPPPP